MARPICYSRAATSTRTRARLLFGLYAERWRESRNDELATRARDASILRPHVLPGGETCR
jgi:hypothetical protein